MDLKDQLAIDDSSYSKLNEEFKTHSQVHSDWIVLAARANRKLSDLRLQLKVLTAVLSEVYRKEYFEKEGKQLAVSFNIKENVLPLKEEWVNLNKEIIQAEEESEIASGACLTFEERGFSLKEVARYVEKVSDLSWSKRMKLE